MASIIKDYYKNYVEEGFDGDGILNKFKMKYPTNFNFAYDIVDKYAEFEPNRRALLWTDLYGNEKTFTFSDLSRKSNQAANLFLSHGIKKGDRILLVMRRNYQFWYVLLALHKIGAIAIPSSHLLTEHDYVYRLEEADIKGAVVTADNPEITVRIDKAHRRRRAESRNFGIYRGDIENKFCARGVGPNSKAKLPFGWQDLDKLINEQSDVLKRVETKVDEGMLLYFTSGTTGYPKMVLHDHSYAIAHFLTAAHWLNVSRDTGLHLTVSDTGWGKAAWGKLYGPLALGACVFVYDFDKFIPENMLRIIQEYRITTFCAPPTMYRFFIKSDLSKFDLSSLKYCCNAGEALEPVVFEQWYEATGIKLMEAFGQTETVPIIGTLIGMTPRPGSMGKPTPLYNVAIHDENEKPVPVGEVGEIVLTPRHGADGIFAGYYRDREKTNEAWRNGIYHTGDTAKCDEDGYYWYVGRNDDLLKTSGYRVGPFEVESVLLTHPAVMECAVVGSPDPVRGQVIKAIVVLVDQNKPTNKESEAALIQELQEHVKRRTAPYKYPRIVEFRDELPKTVSGKVRRVELRG
ncbi:acetyl-CoA synthetase [Clostridia bacterium]|nr:acetyl-CoA synthetase [Clostridia bacterium]